MLLKPYRITKYKFRRILFQRSIDREYACSCCENRNKELTHPICNKCCEIFINVGNFEYIYDP